MTITRRGFNNGVLTAISQAALLCSPRRMLATYITQTVDQPNSRDQFDVATIKPGDPSTNSMEGPYIADDSVVRISKVSLLTLIVIAWNVGFWQVDTKDVQWATKNLYNIVAKPPELKPPDSYSHLYSWWSINDPRLRKMLQSLLLDRFQLKLHKEQRSAPIYLLRRNDRAKLMLVPAKAPQNGASPDNLSGTIGNVEGRGFSIYHMSMPGLAKMLSDVAYHRKVVDQTGLTGIYDFESKIILTAEEFGSRDSTTNFLNAVKEMGLELQKSEGPTDFLIVDSATLPSPN